MPINAPLPPPQRRELRELEAKEDEERQRKEAWAKIRKDRLVAALRSNSSSSSSTAPKRRRRKRAAKRRSESPSEDGLAFVPTDLLSDIYAPISSAASSVTPGGALPLVRMSPVHGLESV